MDFFELAIGRYGTRLLLHNDAKLRPIYLTVLLHDIS